MFTQLSVVQSQESLKTSSRIFQNLPESSRIFQNLPESSRIFLLKDAMRCQPGHNRHNGMGVIEASGVARAICGGFR